MSKSSLRITTNTVIIGAGPSGIFASLELAKNNIATILIDKRDDIGGTAFQYDVNLDYYKGLPKNNHLENIFKNRTIIEKLIQDIYKTLKVFGLPIEKQQKEKAQSLRNRNVEYIDSGILPLNHIVLSEVLNNIKKTMENNNKLKLFMTSKVKTISKGNLKRWHITLARQKRSVEIEADNVIIATGKLSVRWLMGILKSIEIPYETNPQIDVGVRIEGLSKYFSPITNRCLNPKIIIKDKSTKTRTFCWCAGGKVIDYDFYGVRILDGQHLHCNPSQNTNFGIVTTIPTPPNTFNTDFGLNFAQSVNKLGKGKIIVQRIDDFKKNQKTTLKKFNSNLVKPSLKSFELSNIKKGIPVLIAKGVQQMIETINKMYDNVITDDCLVYAPVVERVFPFVTLNENMETNQKGIYMIGDCSGKVTGVISGAAMGIVVANSVKKDEKI